MIEELKDQLREFNYYKMLILKKQTDQRNIIVQDKDGVCQIPTIKIKRDPPDGTTFKIEDIDRVTIFWDGKEYEFVACQ